MNRREQMNIALNLRYESYDQVEVIYAAIKCVLGSPALSIRTVHNLLISQHKSALHLKYAYACHFPIQISKAAKNCRFEGSHCFIHADHTTLQEQSSAAHLLQTEITKKGPAALIRQIILR